MCSKLATFEFRATARVHRVLLTPLTASMKFRETVKRLPVPVSS